MRRRLARRRQGDRAIHQNHRNLRLRAGERETQAFLACEQWADGQRVQHPDQARIVKPGWPLIGGKRGRTFAGRQKLERARHIPAEHADRLAAYEQMEREQFPDPAAPAPGVRDRWLVLRGGIRLERFWIDWITEYLQAHDADRDAHREEASA